MAALVVYEYRARWDWAHAEPPAIGAGWTDERRARAHAAALRKRPLAQGRPEAVWLERRAVGAVERCDG